MALPNVIKQSKLLRSPLLAACRGVFSLLYRGPAVLRRAVYDAMPVPYLVTGYPESFVVESKDRGTGRMLFLTGEQDFWKLKVVLSILNNEGLAQPIHMIDVGANIGTIVIPALRRELFKSATAIEPHPGNLRLLRGGFKPEVQHLQPSKVRRCHHLVRPRPINNFSLKSASPLPV